MDVMEKLVELKKVLRECLHFNYDEFSCDMSLDVNLTAENLIAHGVTVQEWIPFDDVKPKDGESVLGITTEGEMEVYQFDANWQTCLCQYDGNVKVFNITHWMPLPQPPKE